MAAVIPIVGHCWEQVYAEVGHRYPMGSHLQASGMWDVDITNLGCVNKGCITGVHRDKRKRREGKITQKP
jgi:hypothetical protein